MSDSSTAERVLIVENLTSPQLAQAFSGMGAAALPLGGEHQETYSVGDGWRVASHTFNVRSDDSAIVTLILERSS